MAYSKLLFVTFFLDKKSNQKSQGRHDRSAHPSGPPSAYSKLHYWRLVIGLVDKKLAAPVMLTQALAR